MEVLSIIRDDFEKVCDDEEEECGNKSALRRCTVSYGEGANTQHLLRRRGQNLLALNRALPCMIPTVWSTESGDNNFIPWAILVSFFIA